MKQLNIHKLNMTNLNFVPLNKVGGIIIIGGGASEYVQEGLLFQLDCDDVVDGATSFSSKEGLIYEPITFDMFANRDMQRIDHVSKGERGITTPYSGSNKSLPLSIGDFVNKTFEASFLYDGVNAPDAGFWMGQIFGWQPSTAEMMGYVLNFREGVNTLTLAIVNMEDSSVYLNGRKLSLPMMSRMARSASPQKPTIDGDTTIAVLDSELYNIRIYNKALSSEEIRNNHQYDKMMYKPIPPVPENALWIDSGDKALVLENDAYICVDK